MVNYLSNACIEVVQTFLILGNILTSGMNAGASWVLLGKLAKVSYTPESTFNCTTSITSPNKP